MHAIELEYGADEPLVLEPVADAPHVVCRGPAGVAGPEAHDMVARAVGSPAHGPPLAAHVVAGDRVVIAWAGRIPQQGPVLEALVETLRGSGVEEEITVLRAEPLTLAEPPAPRTAQPLAACHGVAVDDFDPSSESATAYLAADEAGRPLHLARSLVDADVVIAVGARVWNAALGGRSPEGELWPSFARQECRQDFERALTRRGRHALPEWRHGLQEVAWQLGVCASLRLVPGRHGTLHAACFGLPDEAGRLARLAAADWCPRLDAAADLTLATLSDPGAGFASVAAAVAAAARVTKPTGTICVCGRVSVGPGLVFLRWRQGAPLDRLVHEAVATGDPALASDALLTRLFARALGERRLVLLSELDESTVEELAFGHAAAPEVVERLAHRAESVIVLEEADLMLPRCRP